MKSPLVGLAAVALGAAAVLALVFWPTAEPTDRPPTFETIPKFDVHVHVPPTLTRSAVTIFGRHGVRLALNASGGQPGRRLARTAAASESVGGAIRPYCHLDWTRSQFEDWDQYAVEALEACKSQGAIGLKIFKALGLGYLRVDGSLLPVDDPVLDIAFEHAARLGLPVLIHVGDPRAFFDPPTPDNERYAELQAHPSWSFHGRRPDGIGNWPSWRALLEQYAHRVARHPRTTFIGAHFGNAPEDPDFVARMFASNENYVVETGARVPEIGRHDPARMRRFFVEPQDRILFGTDFQMVPGGFVLGSAGTDLDIASQIPGFYQSHWRYFETADRGFPHPSPIQGNWTIDGLELPREVLEKVYYRNAERVFGIRLPSQQPSPPESTPSTE